MSLATLDFLPSAVVPRARGRRPASHHAPTRKVQIDCAEEYFRARWPVKKIARMFEVSRATVYLWAASVLGYDDPEADRVRELARRSRRKVQAP